MPAPGWGAEFGNNWGGGGLIYLTGLDPQPGGKIPVNNEIKFTIGVPGALIDLSTVVITVNAILAFDGSTASFTLPFASSSYTYSASDNGYSFVVTADFAYPASVTVVVIANTTDGGSSTQSYSLNAQPEIVYPPTPLGVALTTIPIGQFSGEDDTGILAGGDGQVFFSPALPTANNGSQIDVDSVEVTARVADTYNPVPPNDDNNRPFLWGPPPAVPTGRAFPPDVNDPVYVPVWNSWNAGPGESVYAPLKTTQATATGVLTDTGTGDQTIILY